MSNAFIGPAVEYGASCDEGLQFDPSSLSSGEVFVQAKEWIALDKYGAAK